MDDFDKIANNQPQQAAPQPQVQQAAPQQAAPQQAQPKQAQASNVIELVKGIFTNPAQAVANYVNKASIMESCITVAILALVSAFLDLFGKLLYNFNHRSLSLTDIMYGSESVYGYSAGKIFTSFVMTFVTAIVTAAVLGLMIKVIADLFKKDAGVTYAQGFAIATISVIFLVPFSIISFFLVRIPGAFFSRLSGWCRAFVEAYTYFCLFIGVRTAVKDENKTPICYALTALVVAVVNTILGLLM